MHQVITFDGSIQNMSFKRNGGPDEEQLLL